MARIRTIKPEFWTSEQVVTCSPLARLLFVGLWTFADDNGIHPAAVRRLKMEVFPADTFDDATITGLLAELVNAGLVREYDADGERFWIVTGWHRHQRIDRPTFRHPLPTDATANGSAIRRTLAEDSSNARRAVADASTTDWNGLESNGTGLELERKQTQQEGDASKGAQGSPTSGQSKAAPKFTDDDLKLAQEMFDGIRAIHPDARPPNFDRWANSLRLLRNDGRDRTPEQIRATLAWIRADSFWKTNVLSPDKLREKWDTLQVKLREAQNAQRTNVRTTTSNANGTYRPVSNRRATF